MGIVKILDGTSSNPFYPTDSVDRKNPMLNIRGNLYCPYAESANGALALSASSDSGATWSQTLMGITTGRTMAVNILEGSGYNDFIYYLSLIRSGGTTKLYITKYYCGNTTAIANYDFATSYVVTFRTCCLDSSNNIHIIYMLGISTPSTAGYMWHIIFNGSSFSVPVQIGTLFANSGDCYIDSSDTIHYVGGDWDKSLYYVTYSGGSWGTPGVISSPPSGYWEETAASVVVDSSGNIHVGWGRANDLTGYADIRYMCKPFGEAWSAHTIIHTSDDGMPGSNSLALDQADNIYFIFGSQGFGTNSSNDNILYKKRAADLGDWDATVQVNDTAINSTLRGRMGASFFPASQNIPTLGCAGIYSEVNGINDDLYYFYSDDIVFSIPPSAPSCEAMIPINLYERS